MGFLGTGCGFQAELDAVNENNSTPLHWAARNGHATVGTKLLQANAAVEAAAANGVTPLHSAARNGQAAVAELLLQANASRTAVTKYGKTPADIAKQYGHDELAKRLLECRRALLRSKCRRLKPCRCNAPRRVPKRPWGRRVLACPLCVCASTGLFCDIRVVFAWNFGVMAVDFRPN